MTKLVIASHNEGKVTEIRELLAPIGFVVMSAAELGLPEPEETGKTFAENAILKSESAAKLSGHWSLADDSGLCVDALDGAPGIYSARWAPNKNFMVAAQRIEQELEQKHVAIEGAKAHFICVLALTSPEGETHTFEGSVHGTLTLHSRGEKGFGYDPIFVPIGYTQTFAQMEPAAKHAISHRAHAFEKFMAYLNQHKLG